MAIDERWLEYQFEQFQWRFDELIKQVGRLAYAVEQQVIVALPAQEAVHVPCAKCGCRLLTGVPDKCPACREPLG